MTTKVYRLVSKNGEDMCFLFCGESPRTKGLYCATILRWQRSSGSSELIAKPVLSARSATAVEKMARAWIQNNLFHDYRQVLLREG